MEINNENLSEIVSFAIENGILNMDDVKASMKEKEKERIRSIHPYSIKKNPDGRFRTYVKDETKPHGRRLLVKSNEDDLYELLKIHYNLIEIQKSETLKTLYPKWLAHKKLYTTAITYIERIKCDWNKYYLNSDIIDVPIKKMNKLLLDEWAHKLIQQYGMTKVMYYNATVIIRQALYYAVDLGIIEKNPFEEVKLDAARMFRKVRKKPDNTQVYSRKEEKAITDLAWADFTNSKKKVNELAPLAVIFQFQTGLRVGELCAVRYSDLEKPGYIHIQRMLRKYVNEIVEHTKTGYGDRQVILTEEAQKIINAALQRQKERNGVSDGFIFSMTEKPLLECTITRLYRRYCQNAGIILKSSHKARKTYISSLIDEGCNINTVRIMVGHSDERTTLNNYCFDRSEDAEKRAKFEAALKL